MKQYLVKYYIYFSIFTAFLLYLFLTGNGHLHPLEIIFISFLMFGYLLFIWPEAKIKYDDFDNESQKYSYRLKYQKVSLVFAVCLLLINLFSSIYLYFQHYDIFLMNLIGFIWSVFTIGMIRTNMKFKKDYAAFIERQNTSER
ncbi:hypothetical protein [Macrococcus epidermidis]|uniref:hypothetical protein n=1 Tax=Macrococcus epidermidis TaxID=1902580 RepID=UPI0020B8A5F1|nr:hypothetical protein [Macrococcus epidermidis]UTH16754.1 hypothetical protein KFV12_02995 [Macrococcus epidermidis]